MEYYVVYKNDILGYNESSLNWYVSIDDAYKGFQTIKDRFMKKCNFFNELNIEYDTTTRFEANDGEDCIRLFIVQLVELDHC